MSGLYGEIKGLDTRNSNSGLGNGVRHLFDVFNSSRQIGASNQYGNSNQYDTDTRLINLYDRTVGEDDEG